MNNLNKPIKVLQIIADFKKGGVQADVMYPVKLLNKDDVNFDVLLFTDTIGYYENEFSNYGNIYRIPLKRSNNKIVRMLSLFSNYFFVKKEVKKILDNKKYNAIHSRHILLNAPCISAAFDLKIPIRISHCHVNKPSGKLTDKFYVKLYFYLCSKVLNKKATHKFGVTKSACDYMYGKNNGIVVKNPTVDFDKFNFDKFPNNKKNELNIIQVGSYSSRKNQKFTIKVFEELLKYDNKSRLTFIGYPRKENDEYYLDLLNYVKEKGLNNNIKFLPQDSDVPYELSKSSIMLIPSTQEGLPNVALEAQVMGVPCLISDDVSNDCNCGLCHFLSLSKSYVEWANKIVEIIEKYNNTRTKIDMMEWDNKLVCNKYLKVWRGDNL